MTARAVCGCGREARYAVRGDPARPLCGRCAHIPAHQGRELYTVGTCGHAVPVADMVARRPCPGCRASPPATVAELAHTRHPHN